MPEASSSRNFNTYRLEPISATCSDVLAVRLGLNMALTCILALISSHLHHAMQWLPASTYCSLPTLVGKDPAVGYNASNTKQSMTFRL